MEQNIAFYYDEKGSYAPRAGIPFVQRNNIAAIIKFQKQYLFLSWKEVAYDSTLVTGGIENGEDQEGAVKREVEEETGYYDIESITPVDAINVSRFFVEHKNQNREAYYYPYLVVLRSLAQKEVAREEKKEHSWTWVEEDCLDSVKLFDNHRKMLEGALKAINSSNNNQKVKKISTTK